MIVQGRVMKSVKTVRPFSLFVRSPVPRTIPLTAAERKEEKKVELREIKLKEMKLQKKEAEERKRKEINDKKKFDKDQKYEEKMPELHANRDS